MDQTKEQRTCIKLCKNLGKSDTEILVTIGQALEEERKKDLCGLVVRVTGYRSGGPGSIPDTTKKNSSGSGTGSTQPREYNWGATW
jgi:hypothetical protein